MYDDYYDEDFELEASNHKSPKVNKKENSRVEEGTTGESLK